MTPITRHNGRLVVRHSSREPTPFLKGLADDVGRLRAAARRIHSRPPRAIDVGAGNMRNVEWLRANDWDVLPFDLKPEPGCWPLDLESHGLPVFVGAAELVLCQYLLMFLSDAAIRRLIPQLFAACGPTGMVVVETQAVKTGRLDGDGLARVMDSIDGTAVRLGFVRLATSFSAGRSPSFKAAWATRLKGA
jgi:hypothetical protein